MSIRVILADDHAIVRDGLSRSLQQEADMEVVAQAANGHDAVKLAHAQKPDIVVMDVSMPDLNGIEATRLIVAQCPEVKVLVLSMHARKSFIAEMFKAGAKGYLLKDCEFEELARAIRTMAEGKAYISPAITDVVIDSYTHPSNDMAFTVFSVLTPREREVLQLLAEGNSTKQIGQRLFISPKTVEVHRLKIMDKLNLNNVAQLTKYAIQEGLTSPEP
jgi:two-component system, NarL family, response regulator NreC